LSAKRFKLLTGDARPTTLRCNLIRRLAAAAAALRPPTNCVFSKLSSRDPVEQILSSRLLPAMTASQSHLLDLVVMHVYDAVVSSRRVAGPCCGCEIADKTYRHLLRL